MNEIIVNNLPWFLIAILGTIFFLFVTPLGRALVLVLLRGYIVIALIALVSLVILCFSLFF